MARPSRYTTKLGEAICEEIADGYGLAEVCRAEGMPHRGTVRRWLLNPATMYDGFRTMYARARETQADTHADEITEIADTCPVGGEAKARLRIDARKWSAAKRAPRKYGTDRVEHAGDPEAPIVTRIQRVNRPSESALSSDSAEKTPDA